MAFKTLLQLRTFVRQKADIENDGNHTSDAEINAYIQQAIEHLHSLLVDGTDGTLFAKNAGVLVDIGGADGNAYQLPSDFSQLVSLDIKRGGRYTRSTQADPQDYAQLTLLPYGGSGDIYQHFLRWNTEQGRGELFIFPKPGALADIAAQYVPEAPAPSLDSDTLNWPSFWYQWVVLDAAVKCSIKEESDPQGLMNERMLIEKRLRDHVRSMTPTRVKTIRRVRRSGQSRFSPPNIHRGS